MTPLMRPDPTFYPSAKMAMEGPRETYGFVATLCPDLSQPDAIGVVDLDPRSSSYGSVVHKVVLPYKGDELHHFCWNASSAMLCPLSSYPFTERRYLLVPGLRSSRLYVIDTKPDPKRAHIVKVIEPEELMRKTGYSRPHTIQCGPEGIYVSCLGGHGEKGDQGTAGIFVMDPETFDVFGPWEVDHGDHVLTYDFWWHLPQQVLISSTWGLPPQFENGLVVEDLLNNKYGHELNFWDMSSRRLAQTIDLGANRQMVLDVRPAHEPTKQYGFVNVAINTENLHGEVWLWYKENRTDTRFKAKKVIDIEPEPADADDLPDLLKPFEAVPPIILDVDLSLDDRFLYVTSWGLGEVGQYDVTDPHNPVLAGTIRLGGFVRRTKHPNGRDYPGGPTMVEVSRDGQRVYISNSLYSKWDAQFYPGGIPAVQALAKANGAGGLILDKEFYVTFDEGYRVHQTRLEGGDCTTETFCYPSPQG
jgi:methanethiol oxidase